MMSTTALFLTLSLALFLAIAAGARPLSSDNLIRPVTRPPPSPKSAPPKKHITNNLHNDEPSPPSPESQLKAANPPDTGKIKKRSPPPPCVAANPCSSGSFIAMVTDELARPKRLPPPRPKVVEPPTYIMM